MPRQCFIKNCRSNAPDSSYTPTFTFPPQNLRFDEWIDHIFAGNDYSDVKLEPGDTVCIKHFEKRFFCRYMQSFNSSFQKRSIQRTKLCLKDEAYPSLNLTIPENGEMETVEEVSKKAKRGSSGLANLQKARMRKTLRRERMKNLLRRRAAQKSLKVGDSYDLSKDYFLGEREMTESEKLVVPLRLCSLVKRLHDGSILCKNPPADQKSFPTFNIIQHIDGLSKNGKNPLHWSVDETFIFVKYIAAEKKVAKLLRAEEIDGEALMNLNSADLIDHFSLDASIAESLFKIFSNLRTEVIERFVNV